MWDRVNVFCDDWGLRGLRWVNAFLFVAFVFYFAKWITGIDIGTVIVVLGLIVSVKTESELNLVLVVAKKIMTFGWGLSFFFFSGSVLFLWGQRHDILPHLRLGQKAT